MAKKENSLVAFIKEPTLSKEAQETFAQTLVSNVINGSVDPIQAYVQIKAISEVCEQFLKNQDLMTHVSEAVSVIGKDASFGGAKVSLSNSTKYDYASSGDPQYIRLIKQKEIISSQIKAREMFLKAISDIHSTVDNETGEIVNIQPPAKNVTSTLRVTFAKA